VFLRGRGLPGYVFEAYHLSLQGREATAATSGRRLKRLLATLSAGRISFTIKWLLRLMAAALQHVGMAPVFDVFLYRGNGSEKDRVFQTRHH
jgi:hypothetical protein